LSFLIDADGSDGRHRDDKRRQRHSPRDHRPASGRQVDD